MKRVVLGLKTNFEIGGVNVPANTPVAILETDLSWDSLLSALMSNSWIELEVGEVASALPVESVPEQSSDVAGDESASESDSSGSNGGAPIATTTQADDGEGQKLADAGMTESLATKLASAGIETVEQLGELIGNGTDLATLDGIGPTYAKRIQAWWDAR